MKNQNLTRYPIALLLCLSFTACVSAGKYKDLEAAHNATETSLATCQAQKAELEKKLGITSSQKTELEGSVETMKKALMELEARKAETEKRLAEFRELTDKFKSLVDAGKLSIKVRNGRMMLALSSDILFSSGSAKLSEAGATEIKEVAGLLKDLKNRNFQIEGHTDNVPIRTRQFPSNWELASARAGSVLTTMLNEGFPSDHVSLASYGQYDPLNDNSTPEMRAENRRIAIVVVPDLSGLPGFDELNRMSAGDGASQNSSTAPLEQSKSTPAAASATPVPATPPAATSTDAQ